MKRTLVFVAGLVFLFMAIAPGVMAAKISLRYADHNPESGQAAQRATIPFLKQIEEATNGDVAIETFFGETIFKTRDTWDGLKNGIADMGWMVLSYWPGKVPLTDAFGMPGIAYNNPSDIGAALWRAYEKYPEMEAEYVKGGLRPIIFFASEPYWVATIKKPVATVADMKGLKMRSLGGVPTTQMKALGAVPMSIPMPDNYISLQKGVVDGLGICAEAVSIWRFYEVLKYYNDAPLPASYFTIPISERQWKKIPKETQDQIMSVCGEEGSRWYSENYFGYFVAEMPGIAAENGHPQTFNALTAEARDEWIHVSEPCFDEYYSYADKKGVGTQARQLVKDLMDGTL